MSVNDGHMQEQTPVLSLSSLAPQYLPLNYTQSMTSAVQTEKVKWVLSNDVCLAGRAMRITFSQSASSNHLEPHSILTNLQLEKG